MIKEKKVYHFLGAGPYIPDPESNLHLFLMADAHIIFTKANLPRKPVTSGVLTYCLGFANLANVSFLPA